MMLPFVQENLHFAVQMFAALASFAVAWLIFDAWTLRRKFRDLCKWVGFLLLSISFLIAATIVENAHLGLERFSWLEQFVTLLRVLAYASLIVGQLLDPLQPVPDIKEDELEAELTGRPRKAPVIMGLTIAAKFVLPIGAWAMAYLYWRRSSKGLERHLKPVSYFFVLLGFYELLQLAPLLRGSSNLQLFNLVAAYGKVWNLSLILLFAATSILMVWVWSYLVKRLQSQLFMTFTALSVAIFLVTTTSFTFLLMKNVQETSTKNLKTSVEVLQYAIESKQSAVLASAEVVAQNQSIANAIEAGDRASIIASLKDYAAEKGLSSVIITDDSGQVLLRSDDPERYGDSISEDPLVVRALLGQSASSAGTRSGVVAPVVTLTAAVPIRLGEIIVGSVTSEVAINDAFIDGIKEKTDLDSAVYGGNIRAATTLIAPDGKSRWVGVKEENEAVKKQVLEDGKTFAGPLTILNRSYLAVYAPLKDADQTTVGMLFVGQPQIALLQTAARSIELTFLSAVALLIFMIAPVFWIARRIAGQLE